VSLCRFTSDARTPACRRRRSLPLNIDCGVPSTLGRIESLYLIGI